MSEKTLADVVAKVIGSDAGSGDPQRESKARILATGVLEKVQDWVLGEIERGAEPSLIIGNITYLAIAEVAMILTMTFTNGHEVALARIMSKEFSNEIERLAGLMAAAALTD